jgi:biotin-dependent carboxylase-like uncharacterized protein
VKVTSPGVSSVQDAGRPTARRFGVPPGGALDVRAWALGNAVVGNAGGEAAVEVLAGTFAAEVQARVALASFDGALEVDGRPVPAWTAVDAVERVRVVVRSTSYLVVTGGIDVPVVLGSRSSLGERLVAGDVLPLGRATGSALVLRRPPVPEVGPLRVVPGPQAERFDLDALTATAWTVGPDVNRVGLRLTGPSLLATGGALPPDGVVPGSIQVPPDGRPIVTLADGPTTGGYPKVGVVASVDLGRAGRLRPGDEVRFELVTVDEARALRAAQTDPTGKAVPGAERLLSSNLVSDAVDVVEDESAR